MPRGDIIGHITLTAPDSYPGSVWKGMPILRRPGGQAQATVGTINDRDVVNGYPNDEAALAAYNDPDRPELAEMRHRSAERVIMVVEGAE
jgi:uncharacterized protein (DUF1330 family)